MTQTTARWMEQAEASLLADDWSKTERCLRATEQEIGEAEILLWKTLLARLRLMQGRYDEGDKLLGDPFRPQTRATARLREAFYAARHWQTPHFVKPIVSLEDSVCAYVESNFPEGPFLDLAHWEAWLMRYPAENEGALAVMRTLLNSQVLSGNRLLPSGLEALLAEAWYEDRDEGLQSYPRMAAVEAAGGQKEFQAVTSYIRLLEAIRIGNESGAAVLFPLLYNEAGISLWLRRLPLLEKFGDKAEREHIVYQLDQADVWLGNLIGVSILPRDYMRNVRIVGEHSRQDASLSDRAHEQWNARIGPESTV